MWVNRLPESVGAAACLLSLHGANSASGTPIAGLMQCSAASLPYAWYCACPLPPLVCRRLFESVVPLLPDLVGRLSSEITPFCSVTGLVFDGADEAGGGWHNYFVGLVGSVSAAEDEILWPNQVGGVEGWSRGAVVHCWCVARHSRR